MTSSTTFFAASDFNTAEDFRDHVWGQVMAAEGPLHLVYQGVNQTWVKCICDFIETNAESRCIRKNYNKVTREFWLTMMPTKLHDCHQSWHLQNYIKWAVDGQFTQEERRHLYALSGTTLEDFSGPYAGSRKEPVLFVLSDNQQMPSIVMESGWSENMAQIHIDVDLWFVGGNGQVQLVFNIDWRLHDDKKHVSGSVEVYGLDANGRPARQGPVQAVFPKPSNSETQVINITRRQLFAGNTFPGCNPNDILEYSLDNLRDLATIALGHMGLVPA